MEIREIKEVIVIDSEYFENVIAEKKILELCINYLLSHEDISENIKSEMRKLLGEHFFTHSEKPHLWVGL